MAKNTTLILAMQLVVLTTAPTIRSHSSNLITKEITAYGEMILQGPNTNVIPVAGAPDQPRNFTTFGTLYVLNISLRKDVSSDSLPFAQTQGVLAISSKDGKQVYISVSIIFTFGEYQGSSPCLEENLQLLGVLNLSVLQEDMLYFGLSFQSREPTILLTR